MDLGLDYLQKYLSRESPYISLIIFMLILIATIIASRIYLFMYHRFLKKLSKKTKSEIDDIVLESIERPIYYFIILVGVYIALVFVYSDANVILKTLIQIEIGADQYKSGLNLVFLILIVLWTTFSMHLVIKRLIKWYTEKPRVSRAKKTVILSMKNVIDAFIYIIAFLVILSTIGIEITPLIASLGIGGLAVALALQSTLENYFSGVYITFDRTIKVGDYIELENGMKGYVDAIGWRSTKIRTLSSNLIIIPNSKLTDMIVTNYYYPKGGNVMWSRLWSFLQL